MAEQAVTVGSLSQRVQNTTNGVGGVVPETQLVTVDAGGAAVPYSAANPLLTLTQPAGGPRRGPSLHHKPQLVMLASLTASALLGAAPTGATSASAGAPLMVGPYQEALVWGVILAGTGSPVGVQFGLQICDLYNGVYGAHPSGLSAASTASSGMLGSLVVTQLGVCVRAICIASTAYTGGTVNIMAALKV